MRSWWLDERAHAGTEHLDSGYVSGYDRKAAFDPSDDVDALRRRGIDTRSTVVDLGAGTGTFALALAPFCHRVIAVDVSPVMTAALRERAAKAGIDNVTIIEAGYLSYEHDGEAVDAVYSRNALHQVPDFWKAIVLTRVAGILRAGGTFRLRDLVYDFAPEDADAAIEAWISGAVDDPAVGWTASELAEHVRGEFSTYSWLLDAMLDRTGFDVVERTFRRAAYGTYTCVRR